MKGPVYTRFIISAVSFKQFSNNNATTLIVPFKQKALFKKLSCKSTIKENVFVMSL
jgi:hypothetical protein